nr:PREDICTED: glutamate-rich protein 1 isoform X2 [Paralichthys olivaceus]
MTQRKEVFQSKVLQRLFPAAPKLDKEPSPPCIVEALAKKTFVKRKKAQEDTAADYKTHPEKSVTLSQLESINSAKDPAEESVHESNEELDQDKEQEEHKRKRKRRKRKPGPHQDSGQDGAAPGQSQTVAVVEGGEHISRNKKRKLKKKRHKEKLLSMGEMPRAAALVFTYQKDGGEEEEDNDNERRAAEVSDFLRTTLEIYLSDPKLHVENKSPRLSGTVDNLLSHISSGCEPNSVLKQLYSLKTSVQHKEMAKLEKALQELHNSSSMTAEEYAAVASLFQYWITDILPMRGDKTRGLSTTHP